MDSFEIVIDDEIKLKNDKNNIKFNLFDINEYKMAIASKYDLKKYHEYDVEELYWNYLKKVERSLISSLNWFTSREAISPFKSFT